jgi:hypothetical protein
MKPSVAAAKAAFTDPRMERLHKDADSLTNGSKSCGAAFEPLDLSPPIQFSNPTLLKVEGTPPDALVLVDGIVLGHACDELAVDPGTAEIEVRAESFAPAVWKVALAKGRKTVVQVGLTKAP